MTNGGIWFYSQINSKVLMSASYSKKGRFPTFMEQSGRKLKNESVQDFEFGFRYVSKNNSIGCTFYNETVNNYIV